MAAPSDFLAAYPFDEGSGTSAADVSGTHGAFDLTDSGASWATGVFGNAVRLQNVASVGAAFSPNIDLSSGYTVTFWFRTAQSASNQELLRTGPTAGPWEALVFEAWGDNQMYLGHQDSNGTYRQVAAGNYTGDVWRFFAVTWNAATDTVQAWVGGPATPVSSAGTTGGGGGPGVASQVCYIGGNPGQNTVNIVNGLLDELTFFDRVLSQAEIDDLRVEGIPTGGDTQPITGDLLAVTPTFPGGQVSPGPVNLVGSVLAATTTFPGGTVDRGPVSVAGQLLSVPVSFPQGEASQGYGIRGTLLEVDPAFPGGTVSPGPVTLTGSTLGVSPVFPGGVVSPGAVTLSGTSLTVGVGFPGGRIRPVVVHPDGPATVTVDPIPPAEVALDILVGTAEYA